MSEKTKSEFILRDFLPTDIDAVNDLWIATGMGYAQRGDDINVIMKTINGGGKFIVMEDKTNGRICGTSWLTNDSRRIYLHHFGIHPDYQGKKLSHLLAKASIDFAKECGLQIKLEVHKDNIVAAELYKKHGFKYLGDYNVYIIRSYN